MGKEKPSDQSLLEGLGRGGYLGAQRARERAEEQRNQPPRPERPSRLWN